MIGPRTHRMSSTAACCAAMLSALAAHAAPPSAADLARKIDQRISARLATEGVSPAERADDAEFFRRLNLDLVGCIPTVEEVRSFLADEAADKRSRQIERLLHDRRHARHFARTWRALLLPEADSDAQVRYFVPGFEAWLDERRRANAPFDAIVRELLTVPIAGPDETPQFVLRDLKQPNPLAFIASKNADPAKIAASSTRLFLGLRLECAQCHDHPFDRWTREQFWNQAAFFASIERRGTGTFAPLVETASRTTIGVTDTNESAPAMFLDRAEPRLELGQPARMKFAAWLTAAENPYFARAVVNRLWAQFMGAGLVEPVDDFREENAASHPELLQELADAFCTSRFDLTYLQRAICLTEAYGRTSRQSSSGQQRPELFAKMSIKPLSDEQLYDSFARATGQDQSSDRSEQADDDPVRDRVLIQSGSEGATRDPETSVAQALVLMNGSLVDRATRPEIGQRLSQVLRDLADSPAAQIETLCLATLSRLPSAAERAAFSAYYDQAGTADSPSRLGDIFWVLLNSPEFRWNH